MIYLWHLAVLWVIEYPKSAFIVDVIITVFPVVFVLGNVWSAVRHK